MISHFFLAAGVLNRCEWMCECAHVCVCVCVCAYEGGVFSKCEYEGYEGAYEGVCLVSVIMRVCVRA